jgi:tape measure domain-containing protein
VGGVGGLGAGFAGAFGVRAVTQLVDGSTRITNALKVAGLEGKELADTYERLGKIAMDNGANFESIAGLYAKTSQAAKTLGVSTADVEEFTRRMAVGLRASGTDAGAASAGLMQLNQAMQSGLLRGDEFNSVMENLPVVARAIAEGFGVTTGELRKMAEAGELDAKRVFRAFMEGSKGLDAQAAKTSMTFSQSFENIKTALTIAAGEFNKTTGASQAFADAVNNIVIPAITAFGDGIAEAARKNREAQKDLESIAGFLGLDTAAQNAIDAMRDLGREADPLVQAFQRAQAGIRAARQAVSGDLTGVTSDFSAAMQSLRADGQGAVADELAGAFIALAMKIETGTAAATDFDAVIAKLVNTNDAMADAVAGKLELIQAKFAEAGKAAQASFDEAGKALADALGAKAIATIDALEEKLGAAMPDAVGRLTTALKEAVTIMAEMDATTAKTLGQLQQFSTFSLGQLNTGVMPNFGMSTNPSPSAFGGGGSAVSDYVSQVVKAESGGNASAKNPLSSATGLGQFIESTWLNLFRKHFPAEAANMSEKRMLELRQDPDISTKMIEAYASENAAILRQAGVAVNTAALHLAHFLGPQGAAAVLTAAPGTPVSQLLSQDAIAANPTILGGGATAGDVVGYGQRRAGAYATEEAEVRAVGDAWADMRENAIVPATQAVEEQASAYGGLGQIGVTALRGIAGALSDGKITAQEMLGIVIDIVDQLLQAGSAAGGISLGGGGGGGGGLGGIVGLVGGLFGFAKGGVAAHGRPLKTFAKGGISRSAAIFGEAGPEAAVPLPDGQSIPVSFTKIPTPQVPVSQQARPQVVELRVVGEPGPMFNAHVETVSRDTSVKVTRAGLGEYDKTLNGSFGKRMNMAQRRQM